VSDEAQLLRAGREIEALGIPLRAFYEPDIGMKLTAIATPPLEAALRRHFRKYRLFKGDPQ
jgi:hypothetical protein